MTTPTKMTGAATARCVWNGSPSRTTPISAANTSEVSRKAATAAIGARRVDLARRIQRQLGDYAASRIDDIDRQIVGLLLSRFGLSRHIGTLKAQLGAEPFDPSVREQKAYFVSSCVSGPGCYRSAFSPYPPVPFTRSGLV